MSDQTESTGYEKIFDERKSKPRGGSDQKPEEDSGGDIHSILAAQRAKNPGLNLRLLCKRAVVVLVVLAVGYLFVDLYAHVHTIGGDAQRALRLEANIRALQARVDGYEALLEALPETIRAEARKLDNDRQLQLVESRLGSITSLVDDPATMQKLMSVRVLLREVRAAQQSAEGQAEMAE